MKNVAHNASNVSQDTLGHADVGFKCPDLLLSRSVVSSGYSGFLH